jgi:hypothetical protein
VLEQLAWRLATRKPTDVRIEELLALDDENLRRALEGIAIARRLWPVRPDYRWFDLAEERREAGATTADAGNGESAPSSPARH